MRLPQIAAFVYAIKDPDTGIVRYVGVTTRPFARAKSHLKGWDPITRSWTRGLKKIADFEVLEIVPLSQAEDAESKWLRFYSKEGDLINRKRRGGGFPYGPPTTLDLRVIAWHAGHTIKSLAKAVGCSAEHLSLCARGYRQPSEKLQSKVFRATSPGNPVGFYIWPERLFFLA